MRQAEAGLEELRSVIDTLITIPNEGCMSPTAARRFRTDSKWPTTCCARRSRASPT